MRTAHFVGTTTYGTTAAAEKAGARVRGIHRRLTVTDPETGEPYRVDEPELLLWVHCAEIDSYLHVLRRSGFRLTDAQADRYVAENRVGARLVGLDPAGVPADQAELAAYFEKTLPELAAGTEARDVDDFLTRPPVHPLLVPARALLWRRVARLAYGALPPYAHALYGRPPRRPPRAPGACAPRAPHCASFPRRCAGNSRPSTFSRPCHGSAPAPALPRTKSADGSPYWTGPGGGPGEGPGSSSE